MYLTGGSAVNYFFLARLLLRWLVSALAADGRRRRYEAVEGNLNPMVEGETVEHVWVMSPDINGDGDRVKLETDLGALDGVNAVRVDPSAHSVEVVYDPRVVSLPLIRERIESDGYKFQDIRPGAPRDLDEPTGSTTPGAVPGNAS